MNNFNLKPIVTSILALFMSACTQVSFFVANVPVIFEKEQVARDIVFDENHKITLDVYKPSADFINNAEEKRFPVVIFFYGGSWQDGDKKQYEFVAGRLVSEGYVVVIPNYRKYPKVKFPAFVEDGASAISWVSNNIQNYNGEPQDIVLIGHSAGAHTAALLAADKSYLKKQSVSYTSIKGVVGLSGPYDFTPKAEIYKKIFGPPENYPKMRVTNFIDGTEPPFYLAHGDKDKIVGRFNSDGLSNVIEAKGGHVQTDYYKDMGHTDTIAAFSWVKNDKTALVDEVYSFLRVR
jgi:acetyl esterase/lipase